MSDCMKHFCTCDDLKCPCNPNNPANIAKGGIGCDACIRKNLALGEIPSCIFINLGSIEGWRDFSVEGFSDFVAKNPRTMEERKRCAELARKFDEAHNG